MTALRHPARQGYRPRRALADRPVERQEEDEPTPQRAIREPGQECPTCGALEDEFCGRGCPARDLGDWRDPS